MSKVTLPDPLPYPKIAKADDRLRNQFVYVFKYYEPKGFMFVIKRENNYVTTRIADFEGKIIDIKKADKNIQLTISEYMNRLIEFTKVIRLESSIFYFSVSDIPRLVDFRLSMNKFSGPGYLKDFLGKQGIPIQVQVGEPIVMNEENWDRIRYGLDGFNDTKYILKPSAFKSKIDGDVISPLYGVIEREIKPTS